MNDRRKQMWNASDWRNYNNFRVFIMGSEGNEDIFGDGVVYEGTDNIMFGDFYDAEIKPLVFRGQTGAQDDIIPTADIFTGLNKYYPDNTLTRYLLDLRRYRPKVFQQFFNDLENDPIVNDIQNKVVNLCGLDGLSYLLLIVNEIYNFRAGHWQFVQKYIMSNTVYNKATGGTPITTWLPNQLDATLRYMGDMMVYISNHFLLGASFSADYYEETQVGIMSLLRDHKLKCDTLKNQIEELNSVNVKLLAPVDVNKLNGQFAEYAPDI
jgi:indoleamine 2,3-dioxygenase